MIDARYFEEFIQEECRPHGTSAAFMCCHYMKEKWSKTPDREQCARMAAAIVAQESKEALFLNATDLSRFARRCGDMLTSEQHDALISVLEVSRSPLQSNNLFAYLVFAKGLTVGHRDRLVELIEGAEGNFSYPNLSDRLERLSQLDLTPQQINGLIRVIAKGQWFRESYGSNLKIFAKLLCKREENRQELLRAMLESERKRILEVIGS